MALINRILVPTDFSEHAGEAMAYAAEISEKFHAPIVILHVYANPVIPVPDGYVIVSATELSDLRNRLADGLEKEKARPLPPTFRRSSDSSSARRACPLRTAPRPPQARQRRSPRPRREPSPRVRCVAWAHSAMVAVVASSPRFCPTSPRR